MVKSIKRNHQIIISILTVLIVAAATVAIFYAVNRHEDTPTSDLPTTDSTSISSEQDDSTDEPTSSETAIYEDEKSYSDTTDANLGNDITGILSSIGTQGDWLAVIFTLDQYLSSATCDLKFGDLEIAGDANVSASTSTCSFRLPADHFQSNVLYEYHLTVTSGDKIGVLAGETSI